MDDQSRNLAADNSRDFRSFAVEAFVGHRASGWPFARFDISSRELRVRRSFPCSRRDRSKPQPSEPWS